MHSNRSALASRSRSSLAPGNSRAHAGVAGAVALILLLGGCVTPSRPVGLPIGELHNQGVRYVLEHFERNTPRAEAGHRIVVLTEDYCQRVAHVPRGQCTVFLPERLDDANGIIQGMRASRALKDNLQRVVNAVDAAPTLPDLERRLVTVERHVDYLDRTEARHLSDAISIARSSARLWAPVEQGGLNGGGITFPVDVPAEFRFPWKPLLKGDLIGCLSTILTGGCLGGAVVGTCIAAVEILLSEASLQPGDLPIDLRGSWRSLAAI